MPGQEEGKSLTDLVISEAVQPADWVATPVNNYITGKDILEDGHLPGADHPGSPQALRPLIAIIAAVVIIKSLVRKYEKARAREEASDAYQFIGIFNKLYEKDEKGPACLPLLGVAYYYNEEVSWVIRKFRFLKGIFNKKYGFSEVRAELERASISKLRLQLLHRIVDFRNTQEKIENLCVLYRKSLDREAKSCFDKQESRRLSAESTQKLYKYRNALEKKAKSLFSKQPFEDLSDNGINNLCNVYRNSLQRVVKSSTDQPAIEELLNKLRTLYDNSLQKKVVLFEKCKSEGLDTEYINILRSLDRNFLDEIVHLLKEKELEETELESVSKSIDDLCEGYRNASKKLVEANDKEKYKEILSCVDALYEGYGNFLKKIVESFSDQQNVECLSGENRKQLLAQHCNALQGMMDFNKYLLKPDTWVVAENEKVTMSEEAFKEKLGKAFDEACAESRKSKAEKLKSKIQETKTQLEEYKKQFVFQIEQLEKRLRETESFKDLDLTELQKLKNNPDTDIREIKFSFKKDKNPQITHEYNILLYSRELYKIKKRQLAELEKQLNQGWASKVINFIDDHIITDLAKASFVFWIGFFFASFLPAPMFPAALAVAVSLGLIYLFVGWGLKIYNYYKDKNADKNLDHKVKENLIKEQSFSKEPQDLTLDQEIEKLNQLSLLKSDRVELLEHKETWIYVGAILEGFVRGAFTPCFIAWFFTSMASSVGYVFGIAALFSPHTLALFLAILGVVVLALAIGYGIYKAVSYYKAAQREIDHLRESFHNEKRNQYCTVVDKCCDYLKDKCLEGLVNDGLDATLKKEFEEKLEAQRCKLKEKYLSVISSGQNDQIVKELEEAFSKFFKQKNTEELKNSFDHECKTLTQKFNKPVQSPQLKNTENRFKVTAQACFNFINAGGSGILFFKLLVMNVILGWFPVFFSGPWLQSHELVAASAIPIFLIGGILYGSYSVWKYYRSIKEESIINASRIDINDLPKEEKLAPASELNASVSLAGNQSSDGKTFDPSLEPQKIAYNEKPVINTSLFATNDQSKGVILSSESETSIPVVSEKKQSAPDDVVPHLYGEGGYSSGLFSMQPRALTNELNKDHDIRYII